MPRWVDTKLDELGGLLLPPRCVLCGDRGQRPCLDLCGACEADLPTPGEPFANESGILRPCFAPFSYAYPVDHLVRALKYRGHLAVGRVLGTMLGERVGALGLHAGVDVLLPVPLHPVRHSARGFNQSAEIARWVARRLQLRLDPRLAVRRRDTRPQVGLAVEQRHDNLADAFAVSTAVRGLRIALVDDVTTTGRTLQELAGTLVEAGARSVTGWCIARADLRTAATPDPPPAAKRV